MADAKSCGKQTKQKEFSYWRHVAKSFLRNPGAVGGAVVLMMLVISAVFAPFIAPHDPYDVTAERLTSPSTEYPLGTDALGRCVFSRIIYGGRISLQVGLISVGLAAIVGTILGLVAGYVEGWADNIIMRFMDVLLAFPGILLALVIVAVLGPGLINLMIAIGIATIPQYTRLVRGSMLSEKQEEYVLACRAQGASPLRIIVRHVLPNIASPILVLATLGVAGAILSAAALSFLGLGPSPPTAEWGSMLSGARNYIRRAWWLVTFPGVAIIISVLAINMIGDGLRDALDPQLD